jgi:hypothetical protein
MSGERVLQAGNGVALLQPGREDMSREVVVSAEFGAEDGFAVVPESVHAVQEAGLIWWGCRFWEEPG